MLIYLATHFVVESTLAAWAAAAVSRDPHAYGFAERWHLVAKTVVVFVIWPVCILLGALVHQRAASPATSSRLVRNRS